MTLVSENRYLETNSGSASMMPDPFVFGFLRRVSVLKDFSNPSVLILMILLLVTGCGVSE
jgi:hypothetical protein